MNWGLNVSRRPKDLLESFSELWIYQDIYNMLVEEKPCFKSLLFKHPNYLGRDMRLFNKNIIAFIYIFLTTFIMGQEPHSWIPQNLNTNHYYNNIQFLDSENGFIAGQGETYPIFGKTSDSGFSIRAGVIRVPFDFPTIQGAIDFANSGDTIKVDEGNYIENILLNKNGIILISTSNKEATIIDGSGMGTTFLCVGDNNIISGFTIRNGKEVWGGGIYCIGNSFFNNLIIENNIAVDAGGGIFSEGNSTFSDVIIRENLVEKNFSGTWPPKFGGGGIHISTNSQPIFNDVIIENNSCLYGGGIMLYPQSNPAFNRVKVISNNSNGNGGGIYNRISNFELDGINIISNYAKLAGGGIYSYPDNLIISNSIICNNKTDGNGGGINAENLTQINNSTISFNTANKGGGIFITGVTPSFQALVISNNIANQGSGIYKTSQEGGSIVNSNFLNNGYGVFNSTTTYLFDGKNNWWGDSSGPFHPTQNPNGDGDSVNTYVSINPFSLSPFSNTPPIPVQNITFNLITANSVRLSWDAALQNNIVSYKLYYSEIHSEYFTFENTIEIGNDTAFVLNNLKPSTKYYLTITCFNQVGTESWYAKEISFTTNPLTNIDNEENKPVNFNLFQNYPNPFNPSTKIKYAVPQSSNVVIKVFDVLGMEIADLINEEIPAGTYEVNWNAANLPSGVYFYRLQAGDFVQTRKMILLK